MILVLLGLTALGSLAIVTAMFIPPRKGPRP